MMAHQRKHGSARFSPYYKAQFYDPRDFCWRDVQVRFPTMPAARTAFTDGYRWRIMRIDMQGRVPVPGSDTIVVVG